MANEAEQSGSSDKAAQTIVLGGGGSWFMEAVLDRMQGIADVESGYAQGHVDRLSYEQLCSGSTGHNEVGKLTFDQAAVSLRQILEGFFVVRDPTTPNRQGNDIGAQYRSGIYFYYQNDEHGQIAQEVIDELTKAKAFGRPILDRAGAAGQPSHGRGLSPGRLHKPSDSGLLRNGCGAEGREISAYVQAAGAGLTADVIT